MKYLMMLTLLLSFNLQAQNAEQIQSWILESVEEMPVRGGYELTATPPRRLGTAFTWQTINSSETLLSLDTKLATPSYCTTATYLIFYKVLQKYWATLSVVPELLVLERLKPNMENDGIRIWGRWNSNGPGTAKLIHDTGMGFNFDNINDALPGDFLKIYWNDQVGKLEKGHTVIFLGVDNVNGNEVIRFWGSSSSTQGYGIKTVLKKDAIKTLFTRLTELSNSVNIATIPEKDLFLESMLSRISSWEELRSASGIE
jgi:hypothetical protein